MRTGRFPQTQSLTDLGKAPEQVPLKSAMKQTGAPAKPPGKVDFSDQVVHIEQDINPVAAKDVARAAASRTTQWQKSLIPLMKKQFSLPKESSTRENSVGLVFTHSSLRRGLNRIAPGAGDKGARVLASMRKDSTASSIDNPALNRMLGRRPDIRATFAKQFAAMEEKDGPMLECRLANGELNAARSRASTSATARQEILHESKGSFDKLHKNFDIVDKLLGNAGVFLWQEDVDRFARGSLLVRSARLLDELNTELPILNDRQFESDLRIMATLCSTFPTLAGKVEIRTGPGTAELFVDKNTIKLDPQALEAFQALLDEFEHTYLADTLQQQSIQSQGIAVSDVLPPVSGNEMSASLREQRAKDHGALTAPEKEPAEIPPRYPTDLFLADTTALWSAALTLLRPAAQRHQELKSRLEQEPSYLQNPAEVAERDRLQFASETLKVVSMVHADARSYGPLEKMFGEAEAIADEVIATRVVDGERREIRFPDLGKKENYIQGDSFSQEELGRMREVVGRLAGLVPEIGR